MEGSEEKRQVEADCVATALNRLFNDDRKQYSAAEFRQYLLRWLARAEELARFAPEEYKEPAGRVFRIVRMVSNLWTAKVPAVDREIPNTEVRGGPHSILGVRVANIQRLRDATDHAITQELRYLAAVNAMGQVGAPHTPAAVEMTLDELVEVWRDLCARVHVVEHQLKNRHCLSCALLHKPGEECRP